MRSWTATSSDSSRPSCGGAPERARARPRSATVVGRPSRLGCRVMPHTEWHTEDYPEFRSAPPWVMEEMIASGPGLAAPILGDPAAGAVAELVAGAAGRGAPVAVVGCGTSEHGAMAVAEQLTSALAGRAVVHARQAFEAMLEPWPGVCIGISHDGG